MASKEEAGGVTEATTLQPLETGAETKPDAPDAQEAPGASEAVLAKPPADGGMEQMETETTAESIANIPDGTPVPVSAPGGGVHSVEGPPDMGAKMLAPTGKPEGTPKAGDTTSKSKPRWLDEEEDRLFQAVAQVENEIGYNSRIATQASMVKRAAANAAMKTDGVEDLVAAPDDKAEDKSTAVPATPKRRAANFWRMVWKELNLPGRSWYSIRQHYIKLENEIKRQNLGSIQEYHLLRDPTSNRDQVWEAVKDWDEEHEARLFEVVDSLEADLGFKTEGNPLGKGRGRTVSGKRKAKNFWRTVTTNLGLDPFCWEVIREQHAKLEGELRRLKMRTIQEYQLRRRSAPECCHYKTPTIDLGSLPLAKRKKGGPTLEAEPKVPSAIGRPKKKLAKKPASAEVEEAAFSNAKPALEDATQAESTSGRKRRREELSDRAADGKEEVSDEITGDASSMEFPSLSMSGERILARTKQKKRVRNEAAAGEKTDQPNKWEEIRKRFLEILRKMSLARHQLDSYESTGWGQGSMNHRKIKPVAELERARRIVNKRKREAKELLREVYMMNADLPRWDKFIDENGDVDVDELVCSKCGSGDDEEGNDILLCDHEGCFRAYHQKCCEPALNPECLDPENDWFCWQCETYAMCLEMLCQDFDEDWNSWEEVFPELDTPGLQEVELPESDPEDDDWEPTAEAKPEKRGRRLKREGNDGGDDDDDDDDDDEEEEDDDGDEA